MRMWGCVLVAALLAGCNGSAPSPEPTEPPAKSTAAVTVEGPERRILAFGDSLFAGYRLNDAEGYPDRLQAALRARGINATVIDAGVSGDTSAAALQRVAFVLDSLAATPDLALVELGGNDLLRGISPDETRANLSRILVALRERDIPVLLMGMRAPPNLGEAYIAEFDGMYRDLAGRSGARLVPFFLEPIYDKPALLQPDHIHPTAGGVDALVDATVDDVAEALPKAD
jgi:acyl-CoA thioesterase-1